MVDKVMRALDRWQMLSEGSRVIVALSGGADSVALLHSLYSIKEKYNITLAAAHLNHGIRGAEAQRDEDFCKILCEKYHIPLFIEHADIPRLSSQRHIGEELCGREERYRFFEALSQEHGAAIATAHTASDNAETLLLHLTRGSSVAGASGIPPVRGSVIRPLILCTRADVEAYCDAQGLDYVTDSTNLTDDYARNSIRHRVMPVLRELNPRTEEAFFRFCESAALTRDYLRSEAQALLSRAAAPNGWRAEVIAQAHPALQNEALALLCPFRAEARHLALLRSLLTEGGAVDLGSVRAVCKQGLLRFSAKAGGEPMGELPLHGAASFSYGGRHITASIQNSDKEINDLVFRNRRAGDRFTFASRNLTKPLRKALNEQKIPAERRDGLLLLCRGDTVLWCEGLGFSRQGEELVRSRGLKIESAEGVRSECEFWNVE